ncbi:MAG: winged helix-turn-helix transcriptional regulator [Desulfomonilaceae bacterium]
MEDPVLEYRILEGVHADEGRLTQRDISQKIGCSVSSVNFALRLLAVKGYIKISGSNPRNLRYDVTSTGILQKSILAYNFLKRQSALYEEVRRDVLGKLKGLAEEGVHRVAVYGRTPFTEGAVLYLVSEGIQVTAVYVDSLEGEGPFLNRIPLLPVSEFQGDCEVLVLMGNLPAEFEEQIDTRRLICYPGS